MFGKKRKKMENMARMIGGLNITSKASLKQFCLLATQCNVGEAEKLYDFLTKDMEELPMFDPVKPTVMQNVKTTAGDIFSFLKNNKDDIVQGVDFIRSMFGKGGTPPTDVPPTSLPPIN